jgi:hypothetical protein
VNRRFAVAGGIAHISHATRNVHFRKGNAVLPSIRGKLIVSIETNPNRNVLLLKQQPHSLITNHHKTQANVICAFCHCLVSHQHGSGLLQ